MRASLSTSNTAFRLSPVFAIVLVIWLWALSGGALASEPVTYAGDAARTGWYPDQPALHPQLVTGGTFGQLFSTPVDGQVYAQPLVSSGTLFVATETNWIYGMDPRTGAIRWSRNVGPAFDPTVPPISCSDLVPRVGVTGTPVIDPDGGTAYFLAKTYVSGSSGPAAYDMHAVDVTTGAERTGFPVRLSGTAQNRPSVSFDATYELQRPALLLMNGVVYAAFGGHCDKLPYQGWVFGISTSGGVQARWVASSTADSAAGIWQSGGGLVSDGPGRIFLSTGNGIGSGGSPTPPTPGDNPPEGLGQSVVRLAVQPDGSLQAADFFAPYDVANLDEWDADVGSGAPVALPSGFGTASHPHVLVQMTKAGYVYLLDRDHLGGTGMGPLGDDDVIKRLGSYGGVWSRPAVWPGDGGYLYVPTASGLEYSTAMSNGVFRVYRSGSDGNGDPALALAGTSPDGFAFGSGSPVVTSDGTASGSAIVWVVRASGFGGSGAELRAYSAVPVAGQPQLLWSAPIGTAAKFSPPGVGAGRIYAGTADGHVIGFGSPVEPILNAANVSFASVVRGSSETRTATLTAARDLIIDGLSTTNAQFTLGAPSRSLPATLSAGQSLTMDVTFTPTRDGPVGGTLAVSTSAGQANVGLSGAGVSPDPVLGVDPPVVSFGGTWPGRPLTGTATIANLGGSPLTIDHVDLPPAPFNASGVPADGQTLEPGEAVIVDVKFDPAVEGSFASNLVIHSDGGEEEVGLSGVGGPHPQVEVTPAALDFGSVATGAARSQSFVVHNTGATATQIMKSKPPAGATFVATSRLPEGTLLLGGQSRTLTVEFRPSAVGPASDGWTITADDGSGPHIVQFSGTGATRDTPAPALTVGASPFQTPAPVPVLSRLRVRPTRFAAGKRARVEFRLTSAAKVGFKIVSHTRSASRAWTVKARTGANRVLLPRTYRKRAGRFKLVATPVGGSARRAAYRVIARR